MSNLVSKPLRLIMIQARASIAGGPKGGADLDGSSNRLANAVPAENARSRTSETKQALRNHHRCSLVNLGA